MDKYIRQMDKYIDIRIEIFKKKQIENYKERRLVVWQISFDESDNNNNTIYSQQNNNNNNNNNNDKMLT